VPEIMADMFTAKFVIENIAWTIALMLFLRAFEWARGKPIEAKRRGAFWFVCSVGAFLVISLLTSVAKGPSSPDLRGGFDEATVTILPGKPNSSGLLLVFHVRNVGVPSIVEGYQLSVTPAGWTTDIIGTELFIPKVLQLPPSANTPQVFMNPFICGKDALYRKTTEPLAYGTQQRGYLFYELPGIPPNNFSNPAGTKFRMTFSDVLGKKYTSDWTWPAVSMPTGYMPGISVPNTPNNPDEACN
jgi:hypothetical protein